MVTWRILVAGLCLAVLCLLAPRPSTGEPYLICDPYPKNGDQPTRFLIVVGKLKYSVPPQWLPDRSVRLKFDLSQLPDGEHTMHVTAIDDRNHGKSDSIRLTLVKSVSRSHRKGCLASRASSRMTGWATLVRSAKTV